MSAAIRILVVDDNAAIHEDFRKILRPDRAPAPLAAARAALFGEQSAVAALAPDYDVECASQGEEGLRLARQAVAGGAPYSVAFVDMRMPPGWDGLRTCQELWAADPGLQIVICTAFSDHSHDEIRRVLGATDALLILKKPFDPVEVRQLAGTLARKRELQRQADVRREELERLVEARTAELRAAKDKAQDAARAKSEFLANMSHEIRTPLTAMLGYADLLMDPGLEPADLAQYVQTVRRNGAHLMAVLNAILDLSRIEAGRMTVESLECSPVALLHEVGDMLRARAVEKGLRFEVRQEGPLPATIRTDPTRVRQILLNLCGNALKFTEKGDVRLLACLATKPDGPSPALDFVVQDSGIGLTPAQVERLFQPFEQADTSTTRRFGGTGLGLVISRRLARMLGGDVQVASVPLQGSTFTLRVPTGSLAGVAMVDEDTPPPRSARLEPDDRLRLSGRILLAEDTRDSALVISTMLRRAGAEVVVVDTGLDALNQAQAAEAAGRPFALLLMDLHMPELDGLQATRRLRESGYVRPIVALTANSMPGDRTECLRAGCDEYASKPVRRAELLALCARLMAPATAAI
ncbi:MAG TPA: response regulator [Planctomycetota bacterium]|nr:response regulator [Planctomycetota bacterium]